MSFLDLPSLSNFTYFTLSLIAVSCYVLGVLFAIAALWRARTPQGATAWVIALVSFPFVSVPLFIIFGRNKFYGYVKRRQVQDAKTQRLIEDIEAFEKLQEHDEDYASFAEILDQTSQPGFTKDNHVELLIDGENTYASMLNALENAQHYILFQFYTFRFDKIGKEFLAMLKKKHEQGVKVYFMYDSLGSRVKHKHFKDIIEAGVEVCEFITNSKKFNSYFQVNFRNHRKIIVVDGRHAFIGGFNIGDEYLGNSAIGHWRDTHCKITGPAVLSAQISFLKDWYCACEKFPELSWTPYRIKGSTSKAMILHTGPADTIESNLLAHMVLFEKAKKRIWIANPYFLPSGSLMAALILASLRGVDVKVIVPKKNDSIMVHMASQAYQEKLLAHNIEIHQYQNGFSHQKTILIDDHLSLISSSNLDSRSLFINFEISAIIDDQDFAQKMESTFIEDLKHSKPLSFEYYQEHSLAYKTLVRAFNLLSPIL